MHTFGYILHFNLRHIVKEHEGITVSLGENPCQELFSFAYLSCCGEQLVASQHGDSLGKFASN